MSDDARTWLEKLGKTPQAEESIATVVLVRGEGAQGQPQWAYALIPAEQFLAFREAEAAGAYDLAEFGTVLHSGAGENPPDELVQRMAEEYGCDADFERHMAEALDSAAEDLPDLSAWLDDDQR